MAQLLLLGVNFMCGLPGAHILGPVLLTLFPLSPLNLAIYAGWLFGLKFSKANWTKKLAPTWKKAALWALLFYALTAMPIYFLLLLIMCKAAKHYR